MPRKSSKTSVAELVKDTPELDVSTVNGATVVEEYEQETFEAPVIVNTYADEAKPAKKTRKPRQYSPELTARIAELEKLQAEIKAAKQAEAPTKSVKTLVEEREKQHGQWQQFVVATLAGRVRRQIKLNATQEEAIADVFGTFEDWVIEELERPTPTPRMNRQRKDEKIPADF